MIYPERDCERADRARDQQKDDAIQRAATERKAAAETRAIGSRVVTTVLYCPLCGGRPKAGVRFDGEVTTCAIHDDGIPIERHRRVHHARCTDPLGKGCRCPTPWPRHPEDINLKHARGGNCWVGVRDGDVCPLHDEPRGDCSACSRCPACDAGGAA